MRIPTSSKHHRQVSLPLFPFLLLPPIFLFGLLSPHVPFLPQTHLSPTQSASASSSTSASPTTTTFARSQSFLPFGHSIHTPCLPNLVLDIPSPATLRPFIQHLSPSFPPPHHHVHICSPPGCARYLDAICNGTLPTPQPPHPPPRLIIMGHLHAAPHTIQCLRTQHGFYSALAAREPLQRWSAEYAAMSGGTTGANASGGYLEFMGKYPDCSLLDYFDGRGRVCADDDDVGERVESVAERLDEGFDVYKGVGSGSVWELVRAVREGVRRDVPSKKFRAFLGMVRLKGEARLYDAVVGVRAKEGRTLC